MGYINNPKKEVYNKTTVGTKDVIKDKYIKS